ncbi:hypothetical protein RF11_11363 [Thelohanellus kitauei]|uniref:Uncharacterized protein n=1 Tax=Thelohanellus kitauei TaxID=669202 RepID=A0A0C2IKJ3_THEKT|nr:hypothetical protein RF11_11363 [Thelohanellus kitauei]
MFIVKESSVIYDSLRLERYKTLKNEIYNMFSSWANYYNHSQARFQLLAHYPYRSQRFNYPKNNLAETYSKLPMYTGILSNYVKLRALYLIMHKMVGYLK